MILIRKNENYHSIIMKAADQIAYLFKWVVDCGLSQTTIDSGMESEIV